ncbi:hypothetical protein YC2023_030258 [Brassica napus]
MSHVWSFEFLLSLYVLWFSFFSFVVTETSNFQPISLEFDPVTPFVSTKLRTLLLNYMKGVPESPQCGFSSLAFLCSDVPINARDILEDQELKNAVKSLSYRCFHCFTL